MSGYIVGFDVEHDQCVYILHSCIKCVFQQTNILYKYNCFH